MPQRTKKAPMPMKMLRILTWSTSFFAAAMFVDGVLLGWLNALVLVAIDPEILTSEVIVAIDIDSVTVLTVKLKMAGGGTVSVPGVAAASKGTVSVDQAEEPTGAGMLLEVPELTVVDGAARACCGPSRGSSSDSGEGKMYSGVLSPNARPAGFVGCVEPSALVNVSVTEGFGTPVSALAAASPVSSEPSSMVPSPEYRFEL